MSAIRRRRRPTPRERHRDWFDSHPRAAMTLGVVAVLSVFAFVLVVLPGLLIHPHPDLLVKDRLVAENGVRTVGIGALVALGGAATVIYGARTYSLGRQGHITGRYSSALELLSSPRLEIRLGGIYALERLLRDSETDHPVIVELLAAYVREHSRTTLQDEGFYNGGGASSPVTSASPLFVATRDGTVAPRDVKVRVTAADVVAAVAVLARRPPHAEVGSVDLRRAVLPNMDMRAQQVDLTGAILWQADLRRLLLPPNAQLCGTRLERADLRRAGFLSVNLRGAALEGANLTEATLHYSDLRGARLTDARLDGAIMRGVKLEDGALSDAQMSVALEVDTIEWSPRRTFWSE